MMWSICIVNNKRRRDCDTIVHTFAPKMFFDILSALYTNECIVLKISVCVSVDAAKYCQHNFLH